LVIDTPKKAHKVTPNITPESVQTLVHLADQAGQAIMEIYQRNSPVQQARKSDSSPLTEADLAANAILVAGLIAQWPHIPVLSEENLNQFALGERPPVYWAVDPLDGTKEFIKRNGEFTVNLALVVDGEPQIGVVGAPAQGLTYLGCAGSSWYGAPIARKRSAAGWEDIRVSGYSPGAHAPRPLRVAMSRSHPSPELAAWLAPWGALEARDVGSSLKFCLVAEGAVDVYPRLGPTCIWDTAAGHALVAAAGGRVCHLNGEDLRYPTPAHTLNPFFVVWGQRAAPCV
jgi:3'(2'), 5'-bisphosphate nucleotidase